MDIFFSYRIEAEAKMGIDYETGEYCETYSQVKFGGAKKDATQEELVNSHKELASVVADTFSIDVKYVTPISNEEYEKEMNEEEV